MMDIEASNTGGTPGNPLPDGGGAYQHDERWLLVQRILASPGFQRAGQLRRILEYITRAALLHPNVALHEYEIACEVLERRANFDPTTDNIVRSQMSQLRRRLDIYFTEQSPHEPLRIIIAKGSYLPRFQSVVQVPTAGLQPVVETAGSAIQASTPPAPKATLRRLLPRAWAVLLGIVLATLAGWGWFSFKQRRSVAAVSGSSSSEFIHLLNLKGPDVTIVVPDASLMLVLKQLDTGLTSQEYNGDSALAAKISLTPDPAMREFLEAIRERRLTTINEAMIAEDLRDTLAGNGVKATIRFSRDMHTRDFGVGNLILIGSRRSNPWTELFAPQTNFRFGDEGSPGRFVFRNMTPAAGEAAVYQPYLKRQGKLSSYADVAFTSNLTHSGYVVLINGSDFAANEAAVRYLLHGHLRDDVASLLRHDDLAYFEILLGGSHVDNDAEESFDPVAVRPVSTGPKDGRHLR